MNVTFQISVLMAVVVAALCSSPPEDPGLRLITKLHKLHQAGVVSEDIVSDACSLSAAALAVCELTPAAPGCAVAGAACGLWSAAKGLWNLFG